MQKTNIKKLPYRRHTALPANMLDRSLPAVLEYLKRQGHTIFKIDNNRWLYTNYGVFIHKPHKDYRISDQYEAMFSYHKGENENWYLFEDVYYRFGELPPNAILI